MSEQTQKKFKVKIVDQIGTISSSILSENVCHYESGFYPKPIVDEKSSAKVAKEKMSAARKKTLTKVQAIKVFIKHGSRRNQTSYSNDKKRKASFKTIETVDEDAKGQRKIKNILVVNNTDGRTQRKSSVHLESENVTRKAKKSTNKTCYSKSHPKYFCS